ncbi:hypothetical protein QR680_014048 [Steinernema hermaphroditum]|uniref:Uncharacterized protein n=1 Tax=Steinernema hermaphroditum TaxID=289476 RepID=A0AA39I9T4_9BILA|nr:hypothetical protein QR680_014048 [Steinernema hermaphroditum]
MQIGSLDISDNLFLAAVLCLYFLGVLIASVICCSIFPERFFPSGEDEIGIVGGSSGAVRMLDLSCFYRCCPCGDFSLRALLRRLVPKNLKTFRRLLHCECLRPAVQGSTPYKVDLICCTV